MLTPKFVWAEWRMVMKKFEKATIVELDIKCTEKHENGNNGGPCEFNGQYCNTNPKSRPNPCKNCQYNPDNIVEDPSEGSIGVATDRLS